MWDREQSVPMIVIIPISIVLLSIAWSPKMRKLQIDHDLAYFLESPTNADGEPKLPKNHRTRYFRDDEDEQLEIESNGTLTSKKKRRDIKDDANKIVVQTNTSRGKATLINSLIKLISIPIFVTFFVWLFDCADISKVHHGFTGISHDFNTQLMWMFVIHILTSFIGYHTAWMGCTITLQRLCFAIPLTLSTPICIAIVLTKKCDFFEVGPCHNHEYNDNGLIVALLSVTLWLGQFFATTYYAWISQDFVMAEEPTLFWIPTYDGKLFRVISSKQLHAQN